LGLVLLALAGDEGCRREDGEAGDFFVRSMEVRLRAESGTRTPAKPRG
jgi:hypothetical protein